MRLVKAKRLAARYRTSVEQLLGKEYDYRLGKVTFDGVCGRPCGVVATIHSCCIAEIYGAEGTPRGVVAIEDAQR